jgi:hypothetical protein
MLTIAEEAAVNSNALDKVLAQQQVTETWHWAVDGPGLPGPAHFALCAITCAAHTALGNDTWENAIILPDDTDADIDPWSTDSAEFAMEAYAGRCGMHIRTELSVWSSGHGG